MKVNEISKKVKTHYEFICYYAGKRVVLIKQTLDELLKENAVKVITWLKHNNLNKVFDGFNIIVSTYNIKGEMQEILFDDLIDYNNGEFDTPYAIEFAKVTSDGTIIERFSVESDEKDIKSIIYQDYLDVFHDRMYHEIIEGMGLLNCTDIDSFIGDTWSYKFNGKEKHIAFERTDYWTGRFRYCINEILMTENVTKIDYFGYTNNKNTICFYTDKGHLDIPVFKK